MTDDNLMSPWKPMTDPRPLKALGKLIEELNECSAAAARCIIQGIDEQEPVTGKRNRRWLEEEMADAYATLALVRQHFNLDYEIALAPPDCNKLLTFPRGPLLKAELREVLDWVKR